MASSATVTFMMQNFPSKFEHGRAFGPYLSEKRARPIIIQRRGDRKCKNYESSQNSAYCPNFKQYRGCQTKFTVWLILSVARSCCLGSIFEQDDKTLVTKLCDRLDGYHCTYCTSHWWPTGAAITWPELIAVRLTDFMSNLPISTPTLHYSIFWIWHCSKLRFAPTLSKKEERCQSASHFSHLRFALCGNSNSTERHTHVDEKHDKSNKIVLLTFLQKNVT